MYPTIMQCHCLDSSPSKKHLHVLPHGDCVQHTDSALHVGRPACVHAGWRDADGVAALAASLGPGVAGKVVVDATNPLTPFPDLEVLWNSTSISQ